MLDILCRSLPKFVATGCVAALNFGRNEPRHKGGFVCGQIDEGFSGGPIVVVRNLASPPIVMGVVSHNLRKKTKETYLNGHKVLVAYPSNLVFGHTLSLVTDLIESHFCK